jgi:dihydrofolate reductase
VSSPRITLIVARARGGAIGRHNSLPWRLPEDLKHFKATTLGHAVLMGRKTFDSIGRPLPGRRNLVLTRDPRWHHEGCEQVDSLATAIAGCPNDSELFIAGGAEVYRLALPLANRLIITEIDLDVPDADAWFEAPDPQHWQCIDSRPAASQTGLTYRIQTWSRRTVH